MNILTIYGAGKNISFIIVALLVLQGCVALQTFPIIARAGDTITVAVGSPDDMTKDNTTLTFTPNGGSAIEIPSENIRSIIRIRPDKTSNMALFNANIPTLVLETSHSQWQTIIVLDLPEDLPQGAGVITVDTQASYSQFGDIEGKTIGLEVLPADVGNGVSNQFSYYNSIFGEAAGDLTQLEPAIQVVMQPPGGSTTQVFSAVTFKINIPTQVTNSSSPVADSDIRVIYDDYYQASASSQIQMTWFRNGDDFTVNIHSPIDEITHNLTRFSVVLKDNPATNQFLSGPTITSITFYDQNGNIATNVPLTNDFNLEIK